MCIPFDLVIPLLGIFPNEISRRLDRDVITRRLIASHTNHSQKNLEATVGKILK